MFFTTAGSETWFKSGLGKSAFTSKIYNGLPLDYYLPGIQHSFEYYHILLKASRNIRGKLVPKFYMFHDSFMMFYQPSEIVYSAIKKKPKKQTAWWRLVSKFIESSEYAKLNKVTAHSQELAALAAAKWLYNIIVGHIAIVTLAKGVEGALEMLAQDQQEMVQLPREAAREALKAVEEYKEAKEGAEEAARVIAGSGGHGYSHEALSVLTFLRDPDEFRKRVRLLKLTAVFMKKFLAETPTSLSHQQTVSQFGGVSGVTRMLRESQLKDILPNELAILKANIPENLAKMLFALKLLQKQVMVYERSATVKPTVFIDKSGSMAETFGLASVPKISVATGLALALYRKFDADVYLFDTEVEKVKPRDVVRTLLTISADGGTRIEEVLEEILRIGKRDRVYIIISDGIDEVSSEVVQRVKGVGLADRIRFILVPPSWEHGWLKNFRYVYANSVAEFTTAVRKMMLR